MKKFLSLCLIAISAIIFTGCYSTITEYDAQGNVIKVTKVPASKDIIEQIAVQNKDKTFLVFREAYVVGLSVSPASTTTDSLLSMECVYAHKNTGLASITKDQQNLDKIADIVKAMKNTDGVSISSSGVSSTNASNSTSTTSSASSSSK